MGLRVVTTTQLKAYVEAYVLAAWTVCSCSLQKAAPLFPHPNPHTWAMSEPLPPRLHARSSS